MADDNNPLKYSDFVEPDGSLDELAKKLDKAGDSYDNLAKKVKSDTNEMSAATQNYSKTAEQELTKVQQANKAASEKMMTDAEGIAASLSRYSAATRTNRKAIEENAKSAEALKKQNEKLQASMSSVAEELELIRQETAQNNQITKLQAKIASSAEGSYNRLSAQYSLNKIYLNNMTAAERENTERGRNLVTQTKAIYEEMKRLQSETGKTSLNVGNYSDAARGLTTQIENQTKELALMRLEGKQGSEEYRKLAEETAVLRDAVKDATKEISNMASDTSTLDSVLGAATAAGGGFSVFTGAMELFGAESENVQEAQRKLQSAIAITTGLQAIQNAVQKQSALMLGISALQAKALAKAEAIKNASTNKGVIATKAATAAQWAFNLAANANPYVLLAVALVTVIGALVLFASGTDKAAKAQAAASKNVEIYTAQIERQAEAVENAYTKREKAISNELELAKAQGKGIKEIQAIENRLFQAQVSHHNWRKGYYSQEVENIDKNKKALENLKSQLDKVNEAQNLGTAKKLDIDLSVVGGKTSKMTLDDARETLQNYINDTEKSLEIGLKVVADDEDIKQQAQLRAIEQQKQLQDLAKKETDTQRTLQDARVKLIQNSYDRERVTIQNNYNRQIADLRTRLAQEKDLTETMRRAMNATIVALEQQMNNELLNLQNQRASKSRDLMRSLVDSEINVMEEGYARERRSTLESYNRQIEDLKTRLETEKGLSVEERLIINGLIENLTIERNNTEKRLAQQHSIDMLQYENDGLQLRLDATKEYSAESLRIQMQMLEKQRQIELAQNKLLPEELRQSEAAINAKWDLKTKQTYTDLANARSMALFEAQQALAESEFNLTRQSEARKTKFRLEQERDRLKKILELNETALVKLEPIQAQIIQNQIKDLDNQLKTGKGQKKDLWDILGINMDSDTKEAISETVQFTLGQLEELAAARVQLAEIAVEAANKEVDAAKSKLDQEIEARNAGYANNVATAQKELDMAKKNQDKALREQEKAQKQQAALQAIQQAGDLVTATAKIWSQLGFWGALPAIAVMWGSFAAAKIKAAQVTKVSNQSTSYGSGGYDFIQAGSHQMHQDVNLGTYNGINRKAEGGEMFAVIRKSMTRKYRSQLPAIIDSLNGGYFEKRYGAAFDGITPDSMRVVVKDGRDFKNIAKDVQQIKKANEKQYIVGANGAIIIKYKNLTRKEK